MGAKIDEACNTIARILRNRKGRPRTPKQLPNYYNWTKVWIKGVTPENSNEALRRDWKQRWEAYTPSDGLYEKAANQALEKAFQGSHLDLYKGLTKAQSFVLVQARTGKIGLRAFLFKRHVPIVITPICPCGEGS